MKRVQLNKKKCLTFVFYIFCHVSFVIDVLVFCASCNSSGVYLSRVFVCSVIFQLLTALVFYISCNISAVRCSRVFVYPVTFREKVSFRHFAKNVCFSQNL